MRAIVRSASWIVRSVRSVHRVASESASLDLVIASELGEQIFELGDRSLVLPQADQGERPPQTDPPPLVVAGELERSREQVEGLLHGRRIPGPLGGGDQVGAGRADLARLAPVVGEDPRQRSRVVHGTLDRLGDRCMEGASRRTGDRRVGHLLDQLVLEAELHIPVHLARWSPRHEPAHLERLKSGIHVARATRRGQDLAPERLSDHRGMQEGHTLGRRQRVDPRGDRRPHRGRKLLRGLLVHPRRDQLLQEEGVTLGRTDDPLHLGRVPVGAQRCDDGPGVSGR